MEVEAKAEEIQRWWRHGDGDGGDRQAERGMEANAKDVISVAVAVAVAEEAEAAVSSSAAAADFAVAMEAAAGEEDQPSLNGESEDHFSVSNAHECVLLRSVRRAGPCLAPIFLHSHTHAPRQRV